MPGVARKDKDTAGGLIVGGSDNVLAEGFGVARVGDAVESHAPFLPPHIFPTMAEGSDNVFANGKKVSRKDDKATCGHLATGSSTVFVN